MSTENTELVNSLLRKIVTKVEHLPEFKTKLLLDYLYKAKFSKEEEEYLTFFKYVVFFIYQKEEDNTVFVNVYHGTNQEITNEVTIQDIHGRILEFTYYTEVGDCKYPASKCARELIHILENNIDFPIYINKCKSVSLDGLVKK